MIKKYSHKGGTVIAIHGAAASFKGNDIWFEFIGGKFVSHPPVCEFEVKFGENVVKTTDEIYLLEMKEDVKPEAYSIKDEIKSPCIWERKRGKGKVVYLALGHDLNAVDSEAFKQMFIYTLKFSGILK
jgi:type 1 glutamine amidotransferase